MGGEGAGPNDLSHVTWCKKVKVPGAYKSFGSKIPEVEWRAINLGQLRELAALVKEVVTRTEVTDSFNGNARIRWDTANMYHINNAITKPLTQHFKCSFVELVAKGGAQKPKWFVSHWWGTPFQQTVALLGFHADQRVVSPDAAYWICTFANCQHDLSGLQVKDMHQSPFVKAIMSPGCDGTVTLLDQHVTTFTRVWCVLENFVSTNWAREGGETQLYDLAAWLPEGGKYGGKPVPAKPTLRIDLGNGKIEERVQDESTGGAFPLTVAARGVHIDLTKASATQPADRLQILHCIAGTPECEQDGPAPETCEAYDLVNANAQKLFAPGAMQGAALRGDAKELQELLKRFPGNQDAGISDGATPLHAAAWKGHAEVIGILLESGASTNSRKDEGATPIFQPAQMGNADTCEVLLRAGADANLCRGDGVSPLLMAAQQGHLKVVNCLLRGRADPNLQSNSGSTPLRVAAKHAQVKKALREAGAEEGGDRPSGSPEVKPRRDGDPGKGQGGQPRRAPAPFGGMMSELGAAEHFTESTVGVYESLGGGAAARVGGGAALHLSARGSAAAAGSVPSASSSQSSVRGRAKASAKPAAKPRSQAVAAPAAMPSYADLEGPGESVSLPPLGGARGRGRAR